MVVSQKIIDSDWHYGFYLNDFTKFGIFPTNSVIKVYLKSSSTQIDQATLNSTNDNYVNEANTSTQFEFPQYQYNSHEAQLANVPKQARVLFTFCRESDNDQIKYLKLEAGDYVLVSGKFDENLVVCENFKNEKGLFPENYLEYIEGLFLNIFLYSYLNVQIFAKTLNIEQKLDSEPVSILNRTQRRYTLIDKEIKQLDTNANENNNALNINDSSKSFSLADSIYLSETDNLSQTNSFDSQNDNIQKGKIFNSYQERELIPDASIQR